MGTINQSEITDLANRMIAIRTMIDSDHMKIIFQKITLAEYSTLKRIFPAMDKSCVEEKLYLQDLTQVLNYSVQQTSRLVQALQGKGYVYWEHDKKGTYVRLTEHGLEIMCEQQKLLIKYFEQVIDRVSKERFIAIMDEMRAIEQIMEEEALIFEEKQAK